MLITFQSVYTEEGVVDLLLAVLVAEGLVATSLVGPGIESVLPSSYMR